MAMLCICIISGHVISLCIVRPTLRNMSVAVHHVTTECMKKPLLQDDVQKINNNRSILQAEFHGPQVSSLIVHGPQVYEGTSKEHSISHQVYTN